MVGKRAFYFALACAVAFHVLLIWLLPVSWRAAESAPVLDVVLETAFEPIETPTIVVPKEPEPLPTPEIAPAPPGEIEADVAVQQPDQVPPLEQAPQPTPLNLAPLEAWDDLFVAPEDELVAAFRGDFHRRLEARRGEQARAALLGIRAIERDGMPADLYNQLSDNPHHFKTAVGCFELRSDIEGRVIGGTGVAYQWWMTGCNEVRRSPFEQAPLEYDALGRALP